jgi:cysteine desulfuration protein SufE
LQPARRLAIVAKYFYFDHRIEFMTLAEKQQQLIDRLRLIEDAHERLAAITARGQKWRPPADGERVDEHRVPGCVSRVWLIGEVLDGQCRWRMDADSPVVKGLVALLCETTDGAAPAELAEFEPEVIGALGLDRSLSPTRLNGLNAVAQTMRAFARHHLS